MFIFVLILIAVIFNQPDSAIVVNGFGPELVINDTIGYLQIPERSADAIEGSAFARQITGLNLVDREKAVVREILSGNVPSFSRKLRPLKIRQKIDEKSHELLFYATCDYLAIGSDQDYLYIPLTPATAQFLADTLHCSLPTKKLVDIIYANAETKLKPQPIPPSDQMTTVPVFKQHTDSVKQQILKMGFDRSADQLIAGHKKDVIISNKIYSPDRNYDRVVIYGWHRNENNPIQPLYNGHTAEYADYSHGVRFISDVTFLDGDSTKIDDILQDKVLYNLLSDEGPLIKPCYPESDIFFRMGNLFQIDLLVIWDGLQKAEYAVDFENIQMDKWNHWLHQKDLAAPGGITAVAVYNSTFPVGIYPIR